MKKIYKYVAPVPGAIIEISMPVGALIVKVEIQNRGIMMWALVSENPLTSRKFTTVGTGQPFNGTYIGTVFDDSFDWHVVEL